MFNKGRLPHGSRWRNAMAAVLGTVVVFAAPATAQDKWMPTTYAEQNDAAWTLYRLLCDPDAPGLPAPSDTAASYCQALFDTATGYLGFLLALSNMAAADGPNLVEPFPDFGASLLNWLRDNPAGEPEWTILANEDAVAVPGLVEPLNLGLRDALGTVVRMIYPASGPRLEAAGAPVTLLMDEPLPAMGDPVDGAEADAVAAPVDAAPAP